MTLEQEITDEIEKNRKCNLSKAEIIASKAVTETIKWAQEHEHNSNGDCIIRSCYTTSRMAFDKAHKSDLKKLQQARKDLLEGIEKMHPNRFNIDRLDVLSLVKELLGDGK